MIKKKAMFDYTLPLSHLITYLQQDLPPQQSTSDIEEPNVPSTEDEESMELINAEVELILERSATESRDVPTVAASLMDHALYTTYKSTPLCSIMPPPPP
ncbi:hypothetical protein K3495_g15215 [Podosphaera aphanis]|nr:hypothetical protein K3495_g15215 [Podosphaera aphanis]